MNTLEVVIVFLLGFVSALPVTLLFVAAMRPSIRKSENQKAQPISPDAITVDGQWRKYTDGLR